MIAVPRALILGLGALFSAYHIVLGLYSIQTPDSPYPALVAMVVYAVATTLSLWPSSPLRMSLWLAAFNVAVAVALPLLVTSQLDSSVTDGYATWEVAAVGTLMTITAIRRRQSFAWAGIVLLSVQTWVWAGPLALVSIGVLGSAVWVGTAHVLTRALAKAARDTRQFALAEREAAEWQAAQEAHVNERQWRLEQTDRMAAPMLRRIALSGGNLSEAERQECRYLEAAIRDEIRGRSLLNDDVRREIMAARRRGTVVTLLDEGGLDELEGEQRDRVLGRLAHAIHDTQTEKIIARTVQGDSPVAITVVGLSTVDEGNASALGQDDSEDEVDLWLEIPR
ncbi:hypothetical protein [Compostimonas suwonensis]|uniref:Signal transduction histidine kinase n=1 Tax=Compostimonas suwonensis TaxID=1048394 RepID=A0A2M9BV00_9MICO|nr:hypothetical protein [Compostimonas suwonensis]PJJ61767.1 hypothetical protein CLV54_2717 [Compostimonas suwonensis]